METAIDTFFGIFSQPYDAGAYIVLFCIPLLVPGWRSLGAIVGTLGALSLWACVQAQHEMDNAPGGAVLGAALALFFVWLATAGLWSGLATRAVVLALRERMPWFSARFAIVVTGFLLWPLSIAAMVWKGEWDRRAPDAACFDTLHAIEVQGAVFHLPAAPFFIVWDSSDAIRHFHINRPLREFCEQAGRSSQPFHAVLLTIEPARAYHKQDPLLSRYCASAASRWGKEFCRLEYPRAAEFLESVKLYSTEEFDHRRMLGSRTGSYEGFLEWRDQALAEKGKLRHRRIGMFDHYEIPDGSSWRSYRVAADASWRDPAGMPHTLSCFKSGPPGSIACETTYRLAAGPQMTYVFGAPEADLELAAQRIDRQVQGMLSELAAAGR